MNTNNRYFRVKHTFIKSIDKLGELIDNMGETIDKLGNFIDILGETIDILGDNPLLNALNKRTYQSPYYIYYFKTNNYY